MPSLASNTPSMRRGDQIVIAYRKWLGQETERWVRARPQGKEHGDFDATDWTNEGLIEGLRMARHALVDLLERGESMAVESLRQIVEDTLLLAANIREGEPLGETGDTPELREAERQWRIVELVVSIAERTAETAGLDEATIWIPDGVADVAFEGIRKPA